MAARRKPTITELGVDIAALDWQRSGVGDGSFEVAFVPGAREHGGVTAARWILLRVAGDPAERVLVYDRVEWLCFIDGARGGEFDPDHAAGGHAGQVPREPSRAGRPGGMRQSRVPAASVPPGQGRPVGITDRRRPRPSGA